MGSARQRRNGDPAGRGASLWPGRDATPAQNGGSRLRLPPRGMAGVHASRRRSRTSAGTSSTSASVVSRSCSSTRRPTRSSRRGTHCARDSRRRTCRQGLPEFDADPRHGRGDAAPARGELPHNGHRHVTQSPLAFPEGPETPPWGGWRRSRAVREVRSREVRLCEVGGSVVSFRCLEKPGRLETPKELGRRTQIAALEGGAQRNLTR